MDFMTQPRGKIPTVRAKPVRSVSDDQVARQPDGKDVQNGSHHVETPLTAERSGATARPTERLYSGW